MSLHTESHAVISFFSVSLLYMAVKVCSGAAPSVSRGSVMCPIYLIVLQCCKKRERVNKREEREMAALNARENKVIRERMQEWKDGGKLVKRVTTGERERESKEEDVKCCINAEGIGEGRCVHWQWLRDRWEWECVYTAMDSKATYSQKTFSTFRVAAAISTHSHTLPHTNSSTQGKWEVCNMW